RVPDGGHRCRDKETPFRWRRRIPPRSDGGTGPRTTHRGSRCCPYSAKPARQDRICRDRTSVCGLFDRVDPVGIESEIILDRRHGPIGRFIRPYRVACALAARRDAVITAIALVGAVGRVIAALQQRHVHVLTGDVGHARIACFAQHQRRPCVGDYAPACPDNDVPRMGRDGDGMIGSGSSHRLACHSPLQWYNPFRTVPSRWLSRTCRSRPLWRFRFTYVKAGLASYTMALQALLNQAVSLHREGRLAEAEPLYRRVLAQTPPNFQLQYRLALLLFQQQRSADALAATTAALAINPEAVEALVLKGV